MSYYYSYYAGYMTDGKVHILGPYDNSGVLHSIFSKSRSFASDLHEDFRKISDKEASESIWEEFSETKYGTDEKYITAKMLPFDELPVGDIIQKGYVPISQVQQYENDSYDFDGFYDVLSPTIYAAKLQNEIRFGKKEDSVDEFGEVCHELSSADYMFYAWVDYNSREYEAFLIRQFFESLTPYYSEDGRKFVVIETEG